MPFIKSDIGAQLAWKDYSSQTLYIASRIIGETANDEYYPERLSHFQRYGTEWDKAELDMEEIDAVLKYIYGR